MAFDDFRNRMGRWPRGGAGENREEIWQRFPGFPRFKKTYLLIGVAVLLALWLASGFYIVGPGEQGVVRQFGKVVKKTTAGLNYRLPWPIQQANVVNVERIQRLEVGFRSDPRQLGRVRPVPQESLMLTGDENIVDAQLIVQYRIKDPIQYLFRIRDAEGTLRAATEVALRSKVGNTTIDDVLTVGRFKVQEETRGFLQQLMDTYESGLLITEVKLQTVDAPEQVKDAFHEVVRAREDREKLINQARGYREDVIPKARGDGARFQAILAEYQKAPRVTKERLYLETLEKVLPTVEKIVLDAPAGSNVVPLLPLRDVTILQRPTGEAKGAEGKNQ